jgi:hypothetical protein
LRYPVFLCGEGWLAMGALQAQVLEQLLERGLAKKPTGLLAGSGARLLRASQLPSPGQTHGSFATGLSALDWLLAGGLPKGALVEIVGRRLSGRFAIGLAALAAATSSGQAAALVDLGDHLDPQAAERAGVDLARLLRVRPRRVKEALASAEMLLAAGFPLVVADLGLAPRHVRYTPDAAWLRLARSAQAQEAALLLLTPYRLSGVVAEAVLSADSARPIWQGSGQTPRLLIGIFSRLRLAKLGRTTPGLSASLSLSVPEAFLPLPLGEGGGEGRPNATQALVPARMPQLTG